LSIEADAGREPNSGHRRDARFPQLIANDETLRVVRGSAVVAD
jgi:hypothetical protein